MAMTLPKKSCLLPMFAILLPKKCQCTPRSRGYLWKLKANIIAKEMTVIVSVCRLHIAKEMTFIAKD